jgi:hypothetical protein
MPIAEAIMEVNDERPTDEIAELTTPRSPWPRALLEKFEQFLAESLNTSRFLLIEKLYLDLCSSLYRYSFLQDNWDSYGAEKPSPRATAATARFLARLHSELFMPNRLIPSAEGGIAVYFRAGTKTSYLEYRNSGEIILAMYDKHSDPIVIELNESDADESRALRLIREYISA